jgi:hypothetical protein
MGSNEGNFDYHQGAVSDMLKEFKMKMQWLIEILDVDLGQVARSAIIIIFCVLIALIYHLLAMLIRFNRLHQQAFLLGQPLLMQIEAGKLESANLSWPDMERLKFSEIANVLKKELSSQKAFSKISVINQGLDLLAEPFNRMICRLNVLGWSACLIGYLGAVFEANRYFRFISLMTPPPPYLPLAQIFAVQGFGLAVGITCLAVSSFARSRLKLLYRDLSNRILMALI